jgi:hypothetical protein
MQRHLGFEIGRLFPLFESSRGLRIPSAGVLGAIKRLGLLGGLLGLRGLLGFCVVPAVIPVAGAGTSS